MHFLLNFGLSRMTGTSNYYYSREADQKVLPWKWLAPEVLIKFKFSTKSDVIKNNLFEFLFNFQNKLI